MPKPSYWKREHGPVILGSIPYVPSRKIAEMYGVSHKWLKNWLRQNFPRTKRPRSPRTEEET